jgi:hypothetical protein
VFDTFGTERLTKWKEFRTELETSKSPLEEVAELWSKAPFVSPFLNPQNSTEWPDPWHLVLDNRYDQLAIVLGMLYTVKLSQRFIDAHCEIHTSIGSNKNEHNFFLVIDKKHALNYDYGTVTDYDKITTQTNILWSGSRLP